MEAPEYVICINCESPCYTFEWAEGNITEATCIVCGVDDPADFLTEEDFEAMTSGG